MTYDYLCSNKKCNHIQEEDSSSKTFKEFHPKCIKCGSKCDYKFTPTIIHFALKDGPSGIAPSKAIRINDHYQKKHAELGKKQKDRYGHLRRDVVPNYNGAITEDWKEAQSLALKNKGKKSASTYEQKIANKK